MNGNLDSARSRPVMTLPLTSRQVESEIGSLYARIALLERDLRTVDRRAVSRADVQRSIASTFSKIGRALWKFRRRMLGKIRIFDERVGRVVVIKARRDGKIEVEGKFGAIWMVEEIERERMRGRDRMRFIRQAIRRVEGLERRLDALEGKSERIESA